MTKRAPAHARCDAEPYRLGDLMVMFGYRDEDSFRAWRRQQEKLGFPLPLPGRTRPLKWARAPIDAWRDAGGRPAQAALAAQSPAPQPIDELAAHRAKLHARLGKVS